MEGKPGSMSAYSRAKRGFSSEDVGPGPAAYDARIDPIRVLPESDAPFGTTGSQGGGIGGGDSQHETDGPGPAGYSPLLRGSREAHAHKFSWPDRFKEKINFDFECGQLYPVWRRLPDPWREMTEKIMAMQSKRPRVSQEKWVSNNCPTIFHPLEIRCFLQGIDGRFYPWRMNRIKSPSPANYNTSEIYTKWHKIPPKINFFKMAERGPLFDGKPDLPGPAAYLIRHQKNLKGGLLLGKSYHFPGSSEPRLFTKLLSDVTKLDFAGPGSQEIPSVFAEASPKAVLAPFRSKTPLGFNYETHGPGPSAPSVNEPPEFDLNTLLYPERTPKEKKQAPFTTSEDRFCSPSSTEFCPAPNAYTIPSFAELLTYEMEKHRPKRRNPKLGFLSSSLARPIYRDVDDPNIRLVKMVQLPGPKICYDHNLELTPSASFRGGCECPCGPSRKWRNLRPKSGHTYVYKGPPRKFADSPGPIYDSAPGYAACKARKSWLDPRARDNKTGFLNSGCKRQTGERIDFGIPGPGIYFPNAGPCCPQIRGTQPCPGPRFQSSRREGPGPTHKLHEKADSSLWRASHLGSFNANLKKVGKLYPRSGGFLKKNLNQAADEAWRITREDSYSRILCPEGIEEARTEFEERGRKGSRRAKTATATCY